MIGKTISNLMIKPGQSPLFESPDKYGLDYEDVSFKTKDGIQLSGWLINGGKNKVIIQSHFGVQCSRCGFTQEGKGMMKNALWTSDIHFLKHVRYLSQHGYSILMYDMRNHGESEQKGWVSWGVDERKDAIAAIDFISKRKEYKEATIGLLAICMGQASNVFAFGMEEEMKSFNQLKTMIAVQPLTYDYFVKAMGLPNFLIDAGNKYNKEKRNIDLTGDSFLPYVKDISIPTLVIQNRNDPMTNLDMVEQYYNDLTVEKQMMWLDLEKKRGATYAWLSDNPEKMVDWFDKYMN